MTLKGVDTLKPDPVREGDPDREAEAFLRICNAIAAELPSIACPHWHEALADLRPRLARAAARRSPGRFARLDGGDA